MKTITYTNRHSGVDFFDVFKIVQKLTTPEQRVKWHFNGVDCYIEHDTDPKKLLKDVYASWSLGLKEADGKLEFTLELQTEIKIAELLNKIKHSKEQIAAEKKSVKKNEILLNAAQILLKQIKQTK